MATEITTSKYYLVEYTYVGPNPRDHADADHVEISLGEHITAKYLNYTINDWLNMLVGDKAGYDTIEQARQAIVELFTDGFREMDDVDWPAEARFKPGKYEQLSAQATLEWAFAYEADGGITADMTDGEIKQYAQDCEDNGRDQGIQVVRSAIIAEAYEIRDRARQELVNK